MSATTYYGKFNYTPYAANENFFLVFVNGWVERGQVFAFSTFTKDGSGNAQTPIFLNSNYVLLAQDQYLNKFVIQDLTKTNYYWFDGTRNASDGTISLNLHTGTSGTLTTVTLSPFP